MADTCMSYEHPRFGIGNRYYSLDIKGRPLPRERPRERERSMRGHRWTIKGAGESTKGSTEGA